MLLRASLAPLVKRKTFVLPSACRALAALPVWSPRVGGMSTVSDSQQKEMPEKQQKEMPEKQQKEMPEKQQKEKPEPQQKEKEIPEKQQKDGFKITFDFIKVVSTVVVGLAGAAYVMWNYPRPENVPDRVLETFESGGKPGWDEGFGKDADAVVKRPDVETQLKEFFYPTPEDDPDASYVLIVGEHGTGKSTAVRRVVREREGINGAIYVSVPDDISYFGGVVASAVGMPDTEPSATWVRASLAIRGAAIKFYDKHKRPAVLIIDGVELFAEKNPEFLANLQDFAKDRTDEGSLRMVFVSSDGSVLEQLKRRSAKSRMRKLPFEVGDISDKEAVEFLKRKGVEQEQAEEAVRDITGGRFELLNDYLSVSTGNDATRQELFKETRDAVESVGIDERHPLFGALVAQQRIDKSPAKRLLGAKADTTLCALLDKNIIAAHPDYTFTFHSRHVESFFKQEVETQSDSPNGETR